MKDEDSQYEGCGCGESLLPWQRWLLRHLSACAVWCDMLGSPFRLRSPFWVSCLSVIFSNLSRDCPWHDFVASGRPTDIM